MLIISESDSPFYFSRALAALHFHNLRGSGNEKTHTHAQIWGLVPGLGGWQEFVYVFFWVHSLWEKKHINKLPRKSWDHPMNMFFYVFFVLRCLLPRGGAAEALHTTPELWPLRANNQWRSALGILDRYRVATVHCRSMGLLHHGLEPLLTVQGSKHVNSIHFSQMSVSVTCVASTKFVAKNSWRFQASLPEGSLGGEGTYHQIQYMTSSTVTWRRTFMNDVHRSKSASPAQMKSGVIRINGCFMIATLKELTLNIP